MGDLHGLSEGIYLLVVSVVVFVCFYVMKDLLFEELASSAKSSDLALAGLLLWSICLAAVMRFAYRRPANNTGRWREEIARQTCRLSPAATALGVKHICIEDVVELL